MEEIDLKLELKQIISTKQIESLEVLSSNVREIRNIFKHLPQSSGEFIENIHCISKNNEEDLELYLIEQLNFLIIEKKENLL